MEHEHMLCDGPECAVMFRPMGNNWYRVERMHDDRPGLGPLNFHSKTCAIRWMQRQSDIMPSLSARHY